MNDHRPQDHAPPTDAEDAAQRGGAEAEPAAGSNKAMGVSGATPVTPGAAQATSGGGAAGPTTSSYKDAVRKGGEQQSPDERQRGWVQVATRPWKAKPDNDLRPMIPLEEEALAAWLMGSIVLAEPPGFLACTHTRVMRVAMLEFFESYLEGRVVAVIPPLVRMPRYIAEKTLLLQLLEEREGNPTVARLTRELVRTAKRTCYDAATRRITFVLADRAAVASWHTKTIEYRGTQL